MVYPTRAEQNITEKLVGSNKKGFDRTKMDSKRGGGGCHVMTPRVRAKMDKFLYAKFRQQAPLGVTFTGYLFLTHKYI